MGKFCTNCGSELESGQDKCQYCGKAVNEAATNQNAQVSQEQTVQNNNQTFNNQTQPKSKIAAGLLGIFLGSFGVHNFYLGYTGKAVGQLLITLLSCFVLSFISGIWGLIEGILILTGSISTDADGNKLVD